MIVRMYSIDKHQALKRLGTATAKPIIERRTPDCVSIRLEDTKNLLCVTLDIPTEDLASIAIEPDQWSGWFKVEERAKVNQKKG